MPPGGDSGRPNEADSELMDDTTSTSKRQRTPSPIQRSLRSNKSLGRQNSLSRNKTPNSGTPEALTTTSETPALNNKTRASFLLRAKDGARVFNNPRRVTAALHQSSVAKYILEGETRSLGDGSALIISMWEDNIVKVPELQNSTTFKLGEWTVTSRRTDRNININYRYAKVGPLADDTDLDEIQGSLRPLDGGEVVDISWIPPHSLPRYTRGKWLRLKVKGNLPSRVAIEQLVYHPQPYLLPLLRCPGCLRIGHSINTCRSSIRCARCSGPHPSHLNEEFCIKPFSCFQCGGSHGPRSNKCPFNQEAQKLYSILAAQDQPLHTINKQLRKLKYHNPQKSRQTPAPSPNTVLQSRSPARQVQPDVPFSCIVTRNKFATLTDSENEEDMQTEENVTHPTLTSGKKNTDVKFKRRSRSQRCRKSPITKNSLSTLTSSTPDCGSQHTITVAEVHHPQNIPSQQEQAQHKTDHSHPLPSRIPGSHKTPPPPYQESTWLHAQSTPSPRAKEVLGQIFSVLKEACDLYQKGTPVPNILITLWPILSSILSTMLL